MRIFPGAVLVCGACACLMATAQPPKTSPKVAPLRAGYEKSLDKARVDFEVAAKQAGLDYKQQLSALLDDETKAGNLDSALAVRAEIKELDGAVEVPNRKVANKLELRRALAGSRWDWGDHPVVLKPDGFAKHNVWDGLAFVIKWEAIDRRTVVLTFLKGRDANRIAVLEFSEALNEFKGIDFDGSEMKVKKRLVPVPVRK